jgi:hypothetical protein
LSSELARNPAARNGSGARLQQTFYRARISKRPGDEGKSGSSTGAPLLQRGTTFDPVIQPGAAAKAARPRPLPTLRGAQARLRRDRQERDRERSPSPTTWVLRPRRRRRASSARLVCPLPKPKRKAPPATGGASARYRPLADGGWRRRPRCRRAACRAPVARTYCTAFTGVAPAESKWQGAVSASSMTDWPILCLVPSLLAIVVNSSSY